jgi:hypothetical protein
MLLLGGAFVVLVRYLRVAGTCVSRDAASGWRICGDFMWWGMLVVFFLSLGFLGVFYFSFLYVVLLYLSLWNYVPLFLCLCFLGKETSSVVGHGWAGWLDHDQQHCYYNAPTVKPEAATAVIELLMMGVRTPETC